MNVAAVIVFYNPNVDALKTVNLLAKGIIVTIVVVNEASFEVHQALAEIENVVIIRNVKNVGLATALNQGIIAALTDLRVEYLLLLDQDSKPTLEMISALHSSLNFAEKSGYRPACVGPKLIDHKVPGAAVQQGDRLAGSQLIPAETIATSGTLISKKVLSEVGFMMDELFIDSIDHEWCLRARSKDMNIFVVSNAIMIHDMGDGGINYFGKFKPLHRSPIRHYYIIRNNLFMMRLNYVPFIWKIKEFLKTIRRFVVYLLISNNKVKTLKLMVSAVKEGIFYDIRIKNKF